MTLKNARPQTAKIEHTKFKTVDNPAEPLASTMTAVRLPESIHRLIAENLPDGGVKAAWLRLVIGSAAIAEFTPENPTEQVAPVSEAVSSIERAIAYLDSQCDGCETNDGSGFNGCDTGFGKWLAKRLQTGEPLLQNHAVRAYKMLQKYKKTQLKPAGITLPEWEEIADNYPDKVTFKKIINGELCTPQRRIELRGEDLAVFSPYDVSGQFQLIARTFKGTFNYKKHGGDDSWRFALDLDTIAKVLRQWPEPTYHHDPAIFGVVEALESDRLAELAKQEAVALDVAKSIGDLVGDLDGQFKNGWSLRDYQKRGVEWLISHGKGRIMRGGILADQPGLGKTLTAMVAARQLNKQTGCAVLIVAPVSLQETWSRAAELVEVQVEITTNSAQKIFKPLERREYLIIADEAHRFQNPKAQCTIAFLELAKHPNCIAVWPLTGTPIKNGRPINLLPLLEAIDHPLAGDKKHFERHYCDAGYRKVNKSRSIWDVSGASHLNELAEATKDAILQRTKIECLPELPEKTRLFKEAELSDATARQYNSEIARMVADYRQRAKDGLVDPNSEALATLNILRRVGSIAKSEAAIEMASELVESGSQVIVFTEFLESAKAIAEALGGELLTGESKPEDRQAMCDRFQSGESKVFVGTIKAGGVGLTLTAASDVILVDRPWTPGDTEQAEDRCIVEGQLVHSRRGFLPIEQIVAGDSVLTHAGKWQAVTDTSRREHRGLLTRITYKRFDEPLFCTHDHKVFAVKKGENQPDWIEAHKLLPGDFLAMPRPVSSPIQVTEIQFPQHLRHNPLQVNQYGVEQTNGRYVRIPDLIPLDSDLLFLFGWYLAEGFASVTPGKGRFISFSGHEKERPILERIGNYLSKFGVKSTIYTAKNSKGIELRAYSIELALWFYEWFGSSCYDKKIPSLLMDLSTEQTSQLVDGYIAGDGYRRSNKVEWVSVSPTLASQVGLLASRCGHSISLRRSTFNTHHWVGGYTENGKPSNPAFSFNDSKYVYQQITKTETFFASRNPKTVVYDLTVDGDHSFVVGQAIVHNCHRLGQKNPVFATWLQYGAIDAAIDGVIQLKQDKIDIVMKGKKKTLSNIRSAADLARQLMAIL